MPDIRNVTHYSMSWDTNDHNGSFTLWANGGWVWGLFPDSPDEFRVIADILRNERPIRFDIDSRRLMAGEYDDHLEPVGEEET